MPPRPPLARRLASLATQLSADGAADVPPQPTAAASMREMLDRGYVPPPDASARLEHHIDELHERGWTVLPNVLSPVQLDAEPIRSE